MKVHDYEKLTVWQKAMDLVEEVYLLSKGFPKEEIYGLTSQIRRAAVSVPSNIAEGSRRRSEKEFVQFLYIALGSASELETQVQLAERLYFCESSQSAKTRVLIVEVLKMLNGLIGSLESSKV